jgi:hypothetical protein
LVTFVLVGLVVVVVIEVSVRVSFDGAVLGGINSDEIGMEKGDA